ncbi:right-handed parallel beta-helix repeat-containing protein [Mycobacterium sp. DL592]|uniref:right-handed parallel beta-helix repeat-containing protein n=1 Tax=Mycobacterium sp. DL592 TaxID=2675524 RepID=UPI001423D7B9|nr:right-handed parallel beta-helix repeat-containing protein [Mycobacterium sp. DL592]
MNAGTTYKHSGVLTINASNVTINGNGATLQATNDATSSLSIVGNGVTLTNLNLSAPLTGTRYDSLNQNSLNILGNNATVSNVTITGSAAAGVFVFGASGFTLSNVTVQNTRADGVHITNGSSFGKLTNVTTKLTGDDGIAVVSYGADPAPSHDIVINSSTVAGTTWGRGLSVVGGYNITVNNIAVSATSAAGIYIASEGAPWYTSSVSNVTITGGTVTGANTSTSVIQGAVLIYAGNNGTSVSNVTISGLTIASTPTTAGRNAGIIVDAGSVSGIRFTNIALKNTSLWPLGLANVPAGSYTASGWTLNGAALTVA